LKQIKIFHLFLSLALLWLTVGSSIVAANCCKPDKIINESHSSCSLIYEELDVVEVQENDCCSKVEVKPQATEEEENHDCNKCKTCGIETNNAPITIFQNTQSLELNKRSELQYKVQNVNKASQKGFPDRFTKLELFRIPPDPYGKKLILKLHKSKIPPDIFI